MTTLHCASSMRSASASAREAAEHHAVRRADARAGEHRDGQLRDHRHIDRDPIALLHAERAQRVREAADLVEELAVRDRARVARLPLPVVGDPVAEPVRDVAVEAVDADVQLPAEEPLGVWHVPGVELGPRLHPVEAVALRGPEVAEAILGRGPLVDPRVGGHGVGDERRRGGNVRSSRSRFSIASGIAGWSSLICGRVPSVLVG